LAVPVGVPTEVHNSQRVTTCIL